MAARAGVRHLQRVSHPWRNKTEGVGPDHDVAERLFDLGHVTGDTFTARRSGLMVSVVIERGCVRPVDGCRAVALKTDRIGGLPQVCVVRGAVHVMAGK